MIMRKPRFDRPFRQSDISTYLICPRMFYFQEMLSIPQEYRSGAAIVGSAAHKVIEKIHSEGLQEEKKIGFALLEALEVEEKVDDVPVFWKDGEKETRLDEAKEALVNYAAKPFNQQANVLLGEASFEVNIGRYPFTGTVDQVRVLNEKLILVDFKLSDMRPSEEFLRRSYQFSIYSYALAYGIFTDSGNGHQISFPKPPDEIWLYHLKDHCLYKRSSKYGQAGSEKGPAVYKTCRTMKDLEYLEKDIARICGSIRRNIFFRNPSLIGSCNGFCRFQAVCLGEMEQPKITPAQMRAISNLKEASYAQEAIH